MFYKYNKLIINSIAIMLFLIFASYSIADVHVVREDMWTYRDLTREYSLETWLCKDKVFRKMDDRITILRYDLNKRWDIDLKAGTYTERPLDSKPPERPPQKEKLHNEGFYYEPEYDWEFKETEEEKVICRIKCRKFIFDGDSDYAEKIVELWLTDDIGINIEKYGESFSKYFKRHRFAELLELSEEYKESFVIYSKGIEEPAIAPQNITESKIIKVEDTAPLDNIYDLPGGLKRIEPSEKQMRY